MKKQIFIVVGLLLAVSFFGCMSTKVAQFTEKGTPVVNIEGIITEISVDEKSYLIDNKVWITTTNKTQYGKLGTTKDEPLHEQFIEPTFRVGNSIKAFSTNPTAKEVKLHTVYQNWNWNAPIMETCEPIFETEAEMIDEG